MNHSFNRTIGNYMELRTLPAMLSVAFVVMSLFQFGGISTFSLNWFGGYDLTTQHAVLGSAAVYLVAFMSSETKSFARYDDWEKIAIALGPAVMLGNEYVTEVNDLLLDLGDPFGFQVAFFLTIVSWGVAVR